MLIIIIIIIIVLVLCQSRVKSTNIKQIGMTLLYHIGATLNTGYLPCHDLMQQRSPGIVAKYEPFDRSNPFDPIKICGAIIDPSEYDVSKHGILSTIIEYHISYTYSNGKPFKLSLSLRINMSMNSIGGLLTIIKS